MCVCGQMLYSIVPDNTPYIHTHTSSKIWARPDQILIHNVIHYNFLQKKNSFLCQMPRLVMGFKKGIHKCVECEKKMKQNPDDTGTCSKCGAAETRLEKTMYKELLDEGNFP